MDGLMSSGQKNKIHPHKFALWIAMGSIAMMFAGLTSAYVVKQAGTTWRNYTLPVVFWISTVVILLSSITMILGLRNFRKRHIPAYRTWISITLLLGIAFGALQYAGFYQLYHQPQQVIYNGIAQDQYAPVRVDGNPGESFLFVIAGMHLLHILGGIVALAIVFIRMRSSRTKIYSSTGLELAAGYWHFVDILWIYLFVFFLANQ